VVHDWRVRALRDRDDSGGPARSPPGPAGRGRRAKRVAAPSWAVPPKARQQFVAHGRRSRDEGTTFRQSSTVPALAQSETRPDGALVGSSPALVKCLVCPHRTGGRNCGASAPSGLTLPGVPAIGAPWYLDLRSVVRLLADRWGTSRVRARDSAPLQAVLLKLAHPTSCSTAHRVRRVSQGKERQCQQET
jgi:hypothetical protein